MKRLAVIFPIILVLLGGCGKSRVTRAEELLKMGSKPEAVKLLSEEISDHPRNAEAYFLYGKVLLQDDRQAAYDKFRSAIKADKSMKDKVCDLLKKDAIYSDLSFLAEIDPEIMKQDADLCYKYRVEMTPETSTASTFADAFPEDPRAPKAIEVAADSYKESGSSDTAKMLYQRIAKEYPTSREGKRATALLSDWWIKHTISLPVNSRWYSRSVMKGQKYRYAVRGEVTKETGLGILKVNSNDVMVFVGSEAELTESQRNSYSADSYLSYYKGPKAQKAGPFGSGVAPKDCSVWFYINCAIGINGSLSVEFEVKE